MNQIPRWAYAALAVSALLAAGSLAARAYSDHATQTLEADKANECIVYATGAQSAGCND